jgi:hypothetical protein
MSFLDELKHDANGLAVLADWLGDGLTPVPQALADERANACLRGNDGKECPNLCAPNWWDSTKDAIADAIKQHVEKKAQLKLETELDLVPRMCRACGCCMPTKVWVPLKHIAAHTPEDVVKKFTPYCKIRQEIENL